MQKITKETKAIADAHLLAKENNSFNDPSISSREDLFIALKNGQTFSKLMNEIEIRFVSITSLMVAQNLKHNTEAYKKGIYKGFKQLLQN
jgi:hypothetical protein